MKTEHGYAADEVISALQKTIRRGLCDEAVFWATEANVSGLGAWVWRRLFITMSEDVGLADPNAPAVINGLYQTSLVLLAHQKTKPKVPGEKTVYPPLQLAQAVWHLARAPKSRELAYAECSLVIRMHRGQLLEVEDWVRDQHTSSGRAMARGLSHFMQPGPQGGRHIENHLEVDGDRWERRFFDEDYVPGKPSDRKLEGE